MKKRKKSKKSRKILTLSAKFACIFRLFGEIFSISVETGDFLGFISPKNTVFFQKTIHLYEKLREKSQKFHFFHVKNIKKWKSGKKNIGFK